MRKERQTTLGEFFLLENERQTTIAEFEDKEEHLRVVQ